MPQTVGHKQDRQEEGDKEPENDVKHDGEVTRVAVCHSKLGSLEKKAEKWRQIHKSSLC